MGMFDEYQSDPELSCPICREPWLECQGKDGPNALLVWRQGVRRALRQRADEPFVGSELDRFTLPTVFTFRCWCPNDHHSDYVGRAPAGVWDTTEPVSN